VTWRPDIQGLRGVAVALVVAFHLGGAELLPGGFVGVDVFFVISGYLITGRLLAARAGGGPVLLPFYARRVRRIAPALIVAVLAALGAGSVLLLPGDWRQLARSALAAVAGLANLFFLGNTGYFDANAALMPLLHTWSLAVEEQFYLLWPLLVLAAARLARGRTGVLAGVLLAVAAASFGANLWYTATEPKTAFFALPARAWELAAGGLIALAPPLRPGRAGAAVAGLAGAGAIAAIAAAALLLSDQRPFPGVAALLPVLGAGLVVWRSSATTIAARLLALRPLAALGAISYSLYLWHWPLLAFWRVYSGRIVPTGTEAAALAAAALALGAASWRWIERPFLRPRRPACAMAITLAAAGAAAAAAALVAARDGFPERLPEAVRALGDLEATWRWTCPQDVALGLPPFEGERRTSCVVGAPWDAARTRAVLWGDSTAEHLLPLLDLAGRAASVAIAAVTPCPAPLDGDRFRRVWPELTEYNARCGAQQAAMRGFLRDHAEIAVVIIAASWTNLAPRLEGATRAPESFERGRAIIRDGLDALLPAIAGDGRRIVLFADLPHVPAADPSSCATARAAPFLLRACAADLEQRARAVLPRFQQPMHEMLRAVAAAHPGVVFYNGAERLCDADRCALYAAGSFIYRDSVHLRRNLPDDAVRALVAQLDLSALLRPR
jgi:peptidoglycan/LPS O-acetylase OafA/YrhL